MNMKQLTALLRYFLPDSWKKDYDYTFMHYCNPRQQQQKHNFHTAFFVRFDLVNHDLDLLGAWGFILGWDRCEFADRVASR